MPAIIDSTAGRDRQLLFLSCPALWPAWPFLPLVRRSPGSEAFGLLYDAWSVNRVPGLGCTVFLANLFLLPPTETAFLALPRETFDTPEEVYAGGWRVD